MQDISIRTAVAIQNLVQRMRDEERGQTAVEYAGILVLIALIFVAIFATNLDTAVRDAVNDAKGKILKQ